MVLGTTRWGLQVFGLVLSADRGNFKVSRRRMNSVIGIPITSIWETLGGFRKAHSKEQERHPGDGEHATEAEIVSLVWFNPSLD